MDAVLDVLVFWVLPPLFMLAVSAAYFVASPTEEHVSSRIAVSAYGAAGAALYLSALLLPLLGLASPSLGNAYLLFWLVPLSLACFSLLRFRGRPRTHLMLVPFAVTAFWSAIVGFTVAVGGK